MSRYLTPSKIGLLALISLYSDSVVPSAATIPILSFLVSHVLPISSVASQDKSSLQSRHVTLAVEDFQKATISHVSGIPGRTIWDLLLNKLWKLNSFDALHVFFDTLSLLLQKPPEQQQQDAEDVIESNPNHIRLSRASPMGSFVRRAQLEFTRLQFHDGVTLWRNFVAYRASTLPQWKKRNQSANHNSFDANLQDENLDLGDRLTDVVYGELAHGVQHDASVSAEDLETLLEYQIDQMQRMGNRLPQAMKAKFRAMLDTGVTVPNLSHYVTFLDAWRSGDYPSSFDNLHRYFDYTMQNRDRTFYQYALLNLAILHADFGCHSEALTAMQETISTARENNDMGCLNYSLSWLYHFGKAHPEKMDDVQKRGVLGTEKEALAFLKAKAKEASMWGLLSTSLLSEAKLGLSNGDSVAQAFESIVRSSHLNVTKDVANAIGSQMSMQSSIFGRLGVSCQAWLSGELFLQCYTDQSPVEDVVHCVCRSALLLAQRGRYEDALARMEEVDGETLRTLRHSQYWTSNLGLIKLRRHLHRDNLVAAEAVLAQLQAPPNLGQDLHFSILTLEIDLNVRRGDYSKAMEILENLASKLTDGEADIFQRIKVMTLKARIYDKAGIPQKGFSVALRAASLAHGARLLPALWEAVGAVCGVLISLKEFSAAAKLLESIMPHTLECEDCNLSAQTFSLLADAHMGMAGQAKAETLPRKEQLTRALDSIGRSFDEFSRLEDVKGQCEMMAKKATIMHLNGDPVLANDCAAKYLDIKRAAKDQI
ncbi:hypothetical protein HO133_000967 [Letharia lupina]|uniref:Anaphase-promoting complex subunit 5 n=1 Tax=Letharia lupina TaxID=560253 RepID=A0A8H6CGU4_9LECA|nr:uncharacterized protein HO133_000967 [Letharia lupina]KAF6222916.1 hypothetical protein HO133_000967 [Letharia lupina]